VSQPPLAGIVVIDLTRVLAGPFCTMILHDLGARVIKVETPGTGDDSRAFGPFLDEAQTKSSYFMSINCGKQSLTLNLKTEGGRAVLADLLRKADVLVENYRPGTLAKLGFPDETIRSLNPHLIYASASGFGYTGPESRKAAYDMIIQALSGLMSITGTEDGRLVRVGSSVADIFTGIYTALGILAALFRRAREGVGARLDIAMLDSTVSVLESAIARYQVSQVPPGPLGSRHPSITPFESFKTQDGEIIIAAGNDRLFAALCDVIGRPDLPANPLFKTNGLRTENFKPLRDIIHDALAHNTSAHWLRELDQAQVPCAKIHTVPDLFAYEQIKARRMLLPVEGETNFLVAGSPLKFSGEPEPATKPKPPALGEHNDAILRGVLGYSDSRIAELAAGGVFAAAAGQAAG
jgi:CoA:oxalate CoA-transferase